MKKNLLKKILPCVFSAFLALAVCSCSAGNHVATDSVANQNASGGDYDYFGGFADRNMVYVESESTESAPSEPMAQIGEVGTTDEKQKESRKIIYSSWYNISTEDYDSSTVLLDSLCEKYGAYYESAETYGEKSEYSNRRANYVIRVPQENYEAFTSEAGTIGTVTSSGENNDDVTEIYFDTEARLESARLREERLLEILANAATLDDVLALERELSDVRYEIENYAGTLKKYDSLISYSTATIHITEVKKVVLPDSEKQSLGTRMSASLGRGFDSFKEGFGNFLVSLSYSLPTLIFVWLPIIVIAVVIFVLTRRRLGKKKAAAKAQKVEKETDGKTENNAETERNED